jgi:hypothetical protein
MASTTRALPRVDRRLDEDLKLVARLALELRGVLDDLHAVFGAFRNRFQESVGEGGLPGSVPPPIRMLACEATASRSASCWLGLRSPQRTQSSRRRRRARAFAWRRRGLPPPVGSRPVLECPEWKLGRERWVGRVELDVRLRQNKISRSPPGLPSIFRGVQRCELASHADYGVTVTGMVPTSLPR